MCEPKTCDYMHIDEVALRSLDVVPMDMQRIKMVTNNCDTLFDLLNHCRTPMGKRTLEKWLRNPLRDEKVIETRLNLVEFFVNEVDARHRIHDEYLAGIPDLVRLADKLGTSCSLLDCCKAYQAVKTVGSLTDFLLETDSERIRKIYCDLLGDLRERFESFVQLIENSVDMDSLSDGDPVVSHRMNSALTNLHEKLRETRKSALNILEEAADYTQMEKGKMLKLDMSVENGFHLRVSLKYEHVIRESSRFEVVDSRKDGVRFLMGNLGKLSETYINVRTEYEEMQADLLKQLRETALTYAGPLHELSDIYAHLDVIVSFATAACGRDRFTRPILLPQGTGTLNMEKVRHPLLECRRDMEYVSNSIKFDEKRFFVITGPNMGGKSTFIRSVGLCALMAHIGCFVPAEKLEISLLDGLFTRIGASDQQCKGVSTFMAEMIEASEILRLATSDSLVIIDELGRGTSTFDGFGIAWSISEELIKERKCFTLFATHFHELTRLEEEFPSVENLMVTYDYGDSSDRLRMLYKVQHGICDQKFGLQVAKMVEFPEEIIKHAQEKINEFEDVYDERKSAQIDQLMTLLQNEDIKSLNDEQLDSLMNKVRDEMQKTFSLAMETD